jgi:phenylacetate-CoA ligase
VGTTFYNYLMPLVRYRLSDTAKWKPGSCACGRSYPMIEKITGKFEDTICGSDQVPVSPSVLTFAFKGAHNIVTSQVAQVQERLWEVRIVPGPAFSEQDAQQIVDNIHTLVDADIQVRVVCVSDIPLSPAGKFRWVVNETSRHGGGSARIPG